MSDGEALPLETADLFETWTDCLVVGIVVSNYRDLMKDFQTCSASPFGAQGIMCGSRHGASRREPAAVPD